MKEIHSEVELKKYINENGRLNNVVIQDLDLTGNQKNLNDLSVDGSFFLGCRIDADLMHKLQGLGAYVLPQVPHLPL